jgi:hypothetical protein
MDMEECIFEELPFGKAALKILGNVSENFRLYSAEWLGDNPDEFKVMKVTGCEFRRAMSGKRKGKLVISIPGTIRSAYVTVDQIDAER